MTRHPLSRFAAGCDEPPTDARVRALLILALVTPRAETDAGRPRLVEPDLDPAGYDPVASWETVTTVEPCHECHRDVKAGEHIARTIRGRHMCAICAGHHTEVDPGA